MNKHWIEEDGIYKLMFAPFYEEVCVLSFKQSTIDPKCFYFESTILKTALNDEYACSVEGAKLLFEDMIAEHYKDEISYYQTLLDAWMEE